MLATIEPAYLTQSEQEELLDHESIIEQSQAVFVEVGNALMAIRDAKLYRATHPSFDAYLAERWPAISKRRGYQLIDAAAIAKEIPITNERQARALKGVPIETAKHAYQAAAQATNGAPSGKAIEQALAPQKHASGLPVDFADYEAKALACNLRLVKDGMEYYVTGSPDGRRSSSQWSVVKSFIDEQHASYQERVESLVRPFGPAIPMPVAMPGAPEGGLSADDQAILLANGWTPAKGYTAANGMSLLAFSYRGAKPVIEVAAYWRRIIRNLGNYIPGTDYDYAAIAAAEEAKPTPVPDYKAELAAARTLQNRLCNGMHNLDSIKQRIEVRGLCSALLNSLNRMDSMPTTLGQAVEAVLTMAADLLSDEDYAALSKRLENVVAQ
mgnify:FL=1